MDAILLQVPDSPSSESTSETTTFTTSDTSAKATEDQNLPPLTSEDLNSSEDHNYRPSEDHNSRTSEDHNSSEDHKSSEDYNSRLEKDRAEPNNPTISSPKIFWPEVINRKFIDVANCTERCEAVVFGFEDGVGNCHATHLVFPRTGSGDVSIPKYCES